MLERGEGGEKAAEVNLSGSLMNHNRKRVPVSWGCPLGFPGASVVKNPPANADSIPGSERSPAGGNGNPLLYSCLGKSCGQWSLVGYSP